MCSHAYRVGEPCPYCPQLAIRVTPRVPALYRATGGERITIRPRPAPLARRVYPQPVQVTIRPNRPSGVTLMGLLALWARFNLAICWPVLAPLRWLAQQGERK